MREDAHHLTGGPDGREAGPALSFGAVAQQLDEGLEGARLDNLAAVVRRRVRELDQRARRVRAGRAAVALQRVDVRRDAACILGRDGDGRAPAQDHGQLCSAALEARACNE